MNSSIEEKLHNALEECLEEEMKSIPTDSEIKKLYIPSKQFKEFMNRLLKREKAKEKYKVVYMHRKKIYQFVAGAAIIFISIQVGGTLIHPNMMNDSMQNDTMYTETMPESADMKVAQSADEATTKSATEGLTGELTGESSNAQADMSEEALWTATVTGTDEALLMLENKTNEEVTYTNILKVEKLDNDNWITIYSNNEIEENILSSGASIDETIKLSDYKIKENGSYRLYRNVNNKTVTVDMELIQ